jgi:hypothetical protein
MTMKIMTYRKSSPKNFPFREDRNLMQTLILKNLLFQFFFHQVVKKFFFFF